MATEPTALPADHDPCSAQGQAFSLWSPSQKERNDMIDVAAYHIAQRSGFTSDPHACWAAAEEQIRLMLSLRESQLRLRTILDNSLDAMIVIDAAGVVGGWNPPAERIFGWTSAEAVGRPIHEMIIPPRHRDAHVAGMRRYLAGGAAPYLNTLVEVRALHRDGHEFPVELTIAPLQAAGKFEFSAFIRDITGRKRSEGIQAARLRLMEYSTQHTLKELLVETLDVAGALTDSPIGFYHFLEGDQKTLSLQAWSTATTRAYCHAAGAGRHYGVDQAGVWVECIRLRRPVIHNDYASLPNKRGLPPGHAEVVREMVVPVFRKGLIVALLGVGNKAAPYGEADLEMVASLADLAWDIVEIKRAQEALRESEERWKFALEGAGEGVWDWNVQTDAVRFSRRWKEMLGYAEDEIADSLDEWKRLVHPDDMDRALAAADRHFSGEVADFVSEHRLRCKDGSWKWILSRGRIVSRSDDGRPLRMIGTHADITDRVRQKESLTRQVAERTAQLRAMASEVAAVEERERQAVARDLHDGLGQLLAVAKLKLSALDFPAPESAAGAALKKEIGAIERLLDQANLDVRALSLQLSPPVLQELELLPVLHWLADEMQRSFRLRVNVSADGLPKPLDKSLLQTLFRAVRELLINVAKHAGIDAVEVEALREEDRLVLCVADNGVGFDPQGLAAPSAGGGYGLFSVRDRLVFLGGSVDIDSSPGNGTVVVLSVPLEREAGK